MNLNNILAKAQRMMMSEQFNRDVERAASVQRGGKGSAEDLSAMEDAVFGMSSSTPKPVGYDKVEIPENVRYQQTNYDGVKMLRETPEQRDMSNSKLPKAVLESFKKTPSPVEAFDINNIEKQLFFVEEPQQQQPVQQKQAVREQKAPQQYQQQAPAGGGIDYNYIKYLINESIKENMNGQLNESATNGFKGMRIAPGNVIQFIDSKGNLYEGQLKLKKKK